MSVAKHRDLVFKKGELIPLSSWDLMLKTIVCKAGQSQVRSVTQVSWNMHKSMCPWHRATHTDALSVLTVDCG